MSELILFPDPDREYVLRKYADFPMMTGALTHAYRVQDAVDFDIRAWSSPVHGKVDGVIAWIKEVFPGSEPTPYDYRRHARPVATRLLFRVADPFYGLPHMISSAVL